MLALYVIFAEDPFCGTACPAEFIHIFKPPTIYKTIANVEYH